ncbi:Ubiquinone biosynthesis protein coq9, mitochondrial [Sporothrix curviconia]|uniref:Ubiquinone biosynthesis protein n=1 Tax=Sporothrix curviconia TaxID=1260050 RepID=A0ABP0AP82_9PEZI
MSSPSLAPSASAAARRLARQPSCARQFRRPAAKTPARAALSTSSSTQQLPCTRRASPTRHGLGAASPSPAFAVPSAARRCFHSYDHPNEPPAQDNFSTAEQAILAAATRHIPVQGFTERTIALGAYDAGYPGISTNILPDGVFSLVRWHLVNQRLGLAARSREILGEAPAENAALAPDEIANRAERLLWERLLANKDIVGRWQEALAIMAQPSYVPASLRELALLADEVWALAGDKAVDPTWYTKRAAVSAIYASSELFMTTDNSGPDFPATREFLERRFRGSQELGGYVRSVGEWVGFAASAGVNVLRSKGVNI